MQRVEITVIGRVQGIGFRYFIQARAAKLNLKGYVRNKDDDKVEIIAEGEEKDLQQLVALSAKGPSLAGVLKQNVNYYPSTDEFTNFRITH